jgi:PiT family inorganic phosphate transporter
MSIEMLLLALAIFAGGYMAFNIGANDVANAMGTSVGSKALSLRQAIIAAAIFEFCGAVLVGSSVSSTISKGIIKPDYFAPDPQLLLYGMISTLVAAGVWLQLATSVGLPVSTTHSIVGAVVGFGLIAGGSQVVQWGKVVQIVLSWVISPVGGALIGYGIYRFIAARIINAEVPIQAARLYTPYLAGSVVFTLILSFIYKGLKNLHLDLPFSTAILWAAASALACVLCSRYLIARFLTEKSESLAEQFVTVEGIFRYLQILTACYVAFAHGANDVANAAGPLATIVAVSRTHAVSAVVGVPFWILVACGVGIVIGLATFGVRVMATIGQGITELTPSRGFAAEFAAATTVLVCSRLGLPISTTHTLVGAVIGVALARGVSALNVRVVRGIMYAWVITLPFTALFTILIYKMILWLV